MLSVLIVVTFGQVLQHEFVNFDDPQYVAENRYVTNGITWSGIRWAFTTFEQGNWHPLTWISLMADMSLFGVNPGALAFVNVLLHAANSVLVFIFWFRATQRLWASAAVAALFALHPTHVESVAWISERKDVLSSLFGLLSLMVYQQYAQKTSVTRYLLVALLFVCSLLAKPMLVTLPFLMLLLDYWPLGRMHDRRSLTRCLLEKLPLFAISVASSIVTVIAQQSGGALVIPESIPLGIRVTNSIVSYARYLGMAFAPRNLTVFYPYSRYHDSAVIVGALILIFSISAAVWWRRKQEPYLLVGWGWFLGSLFPVIGIIQVGGQSIADRYTYLPYLGLFIAICWLIGDLVRRQPAARTAVATAVVVLLAILGTLTFLQVSYWRNSHRLFSHAIGATENNGLAHYNLAQALVALGRSDEAITHYRSAIETAVDSKTSSGKTIFVAGWFIDAHRALGAALVERARRQNDDAVLKQAVAVLMQARQLDPHSAAILNDLGSALSLGGQESSAVEMYAQAIRLEPSSYDARMNLGALLARMGKVDEAVVHFETASRINPISVEPQIYMGLTLVNAGRIREGLIHLVAAEQREPQSSNELFIKATRQAQGKGKLREYLAILERDVEASMR